MRLRVGPIVAWLLAAVAMVALAWLFGLPELAALAVAVTASVLISAAWLNAARAPDVVARVEPSTCNQGDPATLRITFSAAERRRSSPTRLWGRLGTAGEGIVAVATLAPAEQCSVRVVLPTPLRGLVRIGPLSMRLNDPLRIWHLDSEVDCGATLLVRPAVHQLPESALAGGRRPAEGRRLSAGVAITDSDTDLVGLRPYVRGDDVRRIHWRTSARLGEPHVVQVEPPVRSPGTTIVLDQGPHATPEGFERCVSAAASILVAAADAGRHVRLVCRDSDTTVADSDALPGEAVGDLLDVLATVSRQAAFGPSPPDPSTSQEDTLVWCTASTAEAVDAPAGVDVVVTCDEAADVAVRGAATVVRWRAGNSLAQAWETAEMALQRSQ
ncbi:MAG: DUF58 domain-containing protein [Microthrixaceae bacterium]